LKKTIVCSLIVLLCAGNQAFSQEGAAESNGTKDREYTRQIVNIPMRDGTRLQTHIYSPVDASEPMAIMMMRTPYSIAPYEGKGQKTMLGPNFRFWQRGFIFVYQDVRGRFMSEGEFVNMRPFQENKTADAIDENTDTWDTVDWLIKNVKNNNGKVGLWGISYPGFYVSMGIINSHPAIAAASPQAPIGDWFWDDVHHNGAFSLQLAFTFLYPFGQKRDGLTTRWPYPFQFEEPSKYEFFRDLGPLSHVNSRHFHHKIAFWDRIQEHPNYDTFWKSRRILPHLKNIHCAVLTVGGLFDAEDLYGALHTYQSIEAQNPDIESSIIMGPWSHGAWARGTGDSLGHARFGSATSMYYQEEIEYPFFVKHLYGEPSKPLPEAIFFETGANRWREFAQWPPKGITKKTFYLRDGGRLSSSPETRNGIFVSFKSKPGNPVPYTTEDTNRWGKQFMAEDQRFLDRRKDVLSFSTAPLEEDSTIAGPIDAILRVSTSKSSADWIVKVIDVFPEEGSDTSVADPGTKLMIRWEILRGRFRNGFSKPEPFIPDRVTTVPIHMQDVLHTFKKGHRIMIQIQSSFFPFFDRNPQKYVENIFMAKRRDFKNAVHKVYTGKDTPSTVEFGILPQE